MTTTDVQPTTPLQPRELGTVLVTGGASGLGAAVVEAVRAAGGNPVVLDRDEPSADVPHVQVDLADPAAAAKATQQLIDQVGDVSAVVTAAGIDAPGRLLDIDPATWENVVRVNLFGTVATPPAPIR